MKKYRELLEQQIEIPVMIGGKELLTGETGECRMPHDHAHVLGVYHKAGESEVNDVIETALTAREKWSTSPFRFKAAVFLKAAELLVTKYRSTVNAATMLAQSKSVHQAEIDAVCETADFFRFNVKYAEELYTHQPKSAPNEWNWVEYRPLEGFVYAISPFNFVSIAGNLPTAPAIMGNVVIFKPASASIYSSYFIMKILKEAGLPDGVINMLPGDGAAVSRPVLKNPDLAGIHFTGSTATFRKIWKTVGENIEQYRTYPRLVGETGGKDFLVVHESANIDACVTALIRGAFGYQGQKCSATSRAYIPDTIWPEINSKLLSDLRTLKVGDVADLSNFMGAVIDKNAFDRIVSYIEGARGADAAEIIAGGTYDDSTGYFIDPTVIHTTDPHYLTMEEEIFGPVLTVYVYPAEKYEETLRLCNETSIYGLTGGIFASDVYAVSRAYEVLRNAAGNFYINDKTTGAVVGQQPFGGARASGTDDKAGSYLNLIRWVSTRTIKHTLMPPENYRYPHMDQ